MLVAVATTIRKVRISISPCFADEQSASNAFSWVLPGSSRGEDDSFSVEIVGAWRMQWRFRMLWSFGCQHNADLPVGRLAVMWPSVLSQGRSVPLLVPSISEGSDRLGLGIDHALSHDCAPLLRCIFARSHRNGLMRCWRADSPRDRTWVRAELAP